MAYPNATVTSSGINWATFQSDGFQGLLEALITANLSMTSAPASAPTLAASSTGHTLPAATYWAIVTQTNAFGETTGSTASSSQGITLGQELTVTLPSLQTGNTASNVYLSTTSSSAGFALAASGQTGSTVVFTAPLPANSYAVAPPTLNTTGLTVTDAAGNVMNKPLELIRDVEKVAGSLLFNYLRRNITDFLGGQPTGGNPIPFNTAIQKLNHVRGVIALLNQACNEMGTLIDANPGTLGNSSIVGQLFPVPRRTWP